MYVGITECQVIQWFVQPGARVEQFDPIDDFWWTLLICVFVDHLAVRWGRQEALL